MWAISVLYHYDYLECISILYFLCLYLELLEIFNQATETEHVVEFPNETEILGMKVRNIYKRKSYKQLSDLIDTKVPSIITGTPGIGKSYFAIYELFKAFKARRTVVYIRGRVSDCIVCDRGNFYKVKCSSHEFTEFVNHPDTLALYDCATRTPATCSAWKCQVIIVSSPYYGNYSDVMKKATSAKYYMPIWKFEEIEWCVRNIEEFNVVNYKKRFDYFGGVPRYIFSDESKYAQWIAALDGACCDCTVNTLVRVEMDAIDNNIRDLVRHVNPITSDDGQTNYRSYTFSFASDHVCQKAMESIMRYEDAALRRFPNTYLMNRNAALGTLAGVVYEVYAHEVLKKGGGFTCRSLEKNVQVGKFELNPTEACNTFTSKFSGLASGYCRPESKVNASIDSLYMLNESTLHAVFQMTISERHPITKSGLRKLAKHLTIERIDFYFVVPPDCFEDFNKQTFKGEGILDVEVCQHVLCVDIATQMS